MHQLERIFTEIALEHYRDFGHALIYVTKAIDLIKFLGPEIGPPIFKSLTRLLIYSTKEDLIPEFSSYKNVLVAWPKKTKGEASLNLEPNWRPQSISKTMQWVCEKAKIVKPEALHRHLLLAASEQLYYFDIQFQDRFDLPVQKNAGWLTMTHSLTFANAVRKQCTQFPELWPAGLL